MKTLFLTILLTISFSSLAKNADLKGTLLCHTPTMNKVLVINKKGTWIQQEEVDATFKASRSLASAHSMGMKQNGLGGFIQTINYQNKMHKIVIRDLSNLNDAQDFLSIRNSKGHEMTYPLTCEIELN